MTAFDEKAARKVLVASLDGIVHTSYLPNKRSFFQSPLNLGGSRQGVAFFFVGEPEEVDRVREALGREIGLIEVSEQVKDIVQEAWATNPESGTHVIDLRHIV
jgi:hypothetical protein